MRLEARTQSTQQRSCWYRRARGLLWQCVLLAYIDVCCPLLRFPRNVEATFPLPSIICQLVFLLLLYNTSRYTRLIVAAPSQRCISFPFSHLPLITAYTPVPSPADELQIRNKLSLYAIAIDNKDFGLLSQVFTQDVHINFPSPGGENLNGLPAVQEYLKAQLDGFVTQHTLSTTVGM